MDEPDRAIANPAVGHGFFSPTGGLYDPRVVYDSGEYDDAGNWEVRVGFVDLAPSAAGPRAEIFLHQINVTSVGAIEGEQRIRQTVQIQSRWQADRSFQKTSVNSPAVLVARGRSVAIGGQARQTLIFDQALRSSKGRTAA